MAEHLDKEWKLLELITQMRTRLGPDAFDIVDHWESDLCAIGIASPRNHSFLAYLSTFKKPRGRFDVELELPPLPGTDEIYQVAGTFDDLDLEDVVQVVQVHFSRA